MTAVILNILVIALCAWWVCRGWSRGAPCQMPAMLGWGAGILVVHLASPWLAAQLAGGGMDTQFVDGDLTARWLAVLLSYGFTAMVVTLAASPLTTLLRMVKSDVLGGIFGSVLSLLRWITVLSIVLNLWAAADQDCLALSIADGGDGGVVEGVMHVAPLLTGENDFEEIVVRRQLREAKTISMLTPLYQHNIMYLTNWRITPYQNA